MRPIDANELCEGRVCNDPVRIAAMCADTLSLNTLRDEIYQDAVAHGLWDADMTYPLDDCCELINDELKELAEAADDYEYKSGTMDRFCEELADMVIMSMSVAGLHGIDIDAAIRNKMTVNKNRPWKHGK